MDEPCKDPRAASAESRAGLAMDVLAMRPADGIPAWMVHTMDAEFIEQTAGVPPGGFARDPQRVYTDFQVRAGACFIDQFIPDNVLSMTDHGYANGTSRNATTGIEQVILDGMAIDSPEAVVEHMERFLFPARQVEIQAQASDEDRLVAELIARERRVQTIFGDDILKGPYDGFGSMPRLLYGRYGYGNYFMAYALFPEVMARDFAQQAELAILRNRAAARAILDGGLPRVVRLDHDIADSRGTLVDIKSLDRIWMPHLARSIQPLLSAGIRPIWHCDGNLMAMVPRLLEVGIGGFQGFQYENGMDYPAICRMKTRDGDGLLIIGGVSVTRTLPFGSPQDVRDEMKWLVENGPRIGLMLGASSSIAPNTSRQNILTFVEGLHYYRTHGRN